MTVPRLHVVDDASSDAAPKESARRKAATSENVQRRERRKARQAQTRVDAGDLLRDAMRLANVSRQQLADWIGLAKSGVDSILAGEKSLAADDLLTPHPGVRRVAAIYLQLAAQRTAGEQAGSKEPLSTRDGVNRMVETLGDLSRTYREAIVDGVIDERESIAIDRLWTEVIEIGKAGRDTVRAARKAGAR